jgi:hypothetical protein
MKAILAFLLLFPIALQAQDYEKLSEAFTNGDATSIGRMLDSTIDYAEDGKDQRIGRSDAENKLRSFFIANTPRSFKKVHEGVSSNDVHYMIGDLFTSNGNFRITQYLNKSGNQYLIQSIEIEKQ